MIIVTVDYSSSQEMSDIEYRKEYLPGYTGHVPKKNDIYGCTAGDINKIIAKTS